MLKAFKILALTGLLVAAAGLAGCSSTKCCDGNPPCGDCTAKMACAECKDGEKCAMCKEKAAACPMCKDGAKCEKCAAK